MHSVFDEEMAKHAKSWLEIYANLQYPKTPKSISDEVPYRFASQTHAGQFDSEGRSLSTYQDFAISSFFQQLWISCVWCVVPSRSTDALNRSPVGTWIRL
ncbi:hypothetical protein TNCV_1571461 [Trichonephila clavipes]|uniref:Uncharacterized protein n=1 Tax=Trichonephila clavipes TaxID=2585209 RepID=A0A8X6VQ03_TRICX|nr:hypothetical protein TNCV_1571461 [Trichonephila clavipes]